MAVVEFERPGTPQRTAGIQLETLKGSTSLGDFFGIGGMAVNATYTGPANPADLRHDVKVGLAHGWFAPEDAYTGLRQALAQRGVGAFSFDDSRSFGWLGDFNLRNYRHVAEVSSKVAWTAMKIVDRLTGTPNRFVMYGHSMGGQTATDVATFNPTRVEGVITDGSCGAEKHTFGDSLGRTRSFASGELRAKAPELILHGPLLFLPHLAYHALRNPARTLAEGVDAGSTNLRDRWNGLGAVGVRREAIQSRADVYSPVDAVERDNRDVLDGIRRRHSPQSGHLDPQLDPQGTADIIIDILDEWYAQPALERAA